LVRVAVNIAAASMLARANRPSTNFEGTFDHILIGPYGFNSAPFSGGAAHPVIPADFDACNRVVWSIIRLDTAGSNDAIGMPVDSSSLHTLRASRPRRPAG
jgi:hypothetical protein